jgi:hypothetical protein
MSGLPRLAIPGWEKSEYWVPMLPDVSVVLSPRSGFVQQNKQSDHNLNRLLDVNIATSDI